MAAPQSPCGFKKSDCLTPIQTSYFIQGPYNLHYLLFSGMGALLCHYCFHSESQTLFGIGAGRPPITAVAR